MFRGNHPTRVDDKGRLKMPAAYKARVDEIYGNEFYITSTDGKRAQLYPLKEWEKKEEQLAKIPNAHPAKAKFLDVTSYYGHMAKMDDQGRLLLPQILRESAKVTGDVVVLGKMGILEVVNHDDFKGSLEQAPLTAEDMASLAEFGL
jgi:MraZ protein